MVITTVHWTKQCWKGNERVLLGTWCTTRDHSITKKSEILLVKSPDAYMAQFPLLTPDGNSEEDCSTHCHWNSDVGLVQGLARIELGSMHHGQTCAPDHVSKHLKIKQGSSHLQTGEWSANDLPKIIHKVCTRAAGQHPIHSTIHPIILGTRDPKFLLGVSAGKLKIITVCGTQTYQLLIHILNNQKVTSPQF